MENSVQSSDTWFDVSAKRLTEYWDCEGDLLLNWKGRGYKTIFDLLLVRNYLIEAEDNTGNIALYENVFNTFYFTKHSIL